MAEVRTQRSPRSRSLKSRALQLLAQRDQSRAELRRKLLVHARAEAAATAAAVEGTLGAEIGADAAEAAKHGIDAEAAVDAVLAWLEANRFLSDARFAESRVHAREGRFGNLRIRHELAQHSIALSADATQALAASEAARALAVCERKYPQAPAGAAERARQMRFLMARGFSPDAIRQALRQRGAAASPRSDDTDEAADAVFGDADSP